MDLERIALLPTTFVEIKSHRQAGQCSTYPEINGCNKNWHEEDYGVNRKIFPMISALALLVVPMMSGGISEAATLPLPQRPLNVIPTPPQPISATMPVVGPGVSKPPASFPLTLNQLQQTITAVNNELIQAPNGTVSVSPLGWQQSGLTGSETAWAQQAITHYDQQINVGQLQPVMGSTGVESKKLARLDKNYLD